jgi:glycosyltransferase involved in cell wall biosynthesis
MSVSVIIAVKNGAPFIAEAVASALSQAQVVGVVVVDDGSVDATADVVAAIRDPRVTLISGASSGVSAARNLGLAEVANRADVSWVMFLDADDRLRPGAIGKLLATAVEPCVAVYGDYERMNEQGRALGRRGWLRGRAKPSGDILTELLSGNFIVNGGVMLMRRDAFATLGGFDETLRYCEDWHAFCRLAALGCILYVNDIVLDYRVHAKSAMMRASDGFAHYQRALERVFNDPLIVERVPANQAARLASNAEAHLRTYLACQAVRSHAYWRALPQTAGAIRSAPRRAPKTMMHILGAAAGF